MAKQLMIGRLINIPLFFVFQLGRRSWLRPWRLFDCQVLHPIIFGQVMYL